MYVEYDILIYMCNMPFNILIYMIYMCNVAYIIIILNPTPKYILICKILIYPGDVGSIEVLLRLY